MVSYSPVPAEGAIRFTCARCGQRGRLGSRTSPDRRRRYVLVRSGCWATGALVRRPSRTPPALIRSRPIVARHVGAGYDARVLLHELVATSAVVAKASSRLVKIT